MGSLSQTIQKDQRTVVEGAEYVTAPESTMGLPYSITVGERGRATFNIKTSAEAAQDQSNVNIAEYFGSILSNQSSVMSKVLGVADQIASGFFEQSKDQARNYDESVKGTVGLASEFMASLGDNISNTIAKILPTTAEPVIDRGDVDLTGDGGFAIDNKMILVVIAILVAIFLLGR